MEEMMEAPMEMMENMDAFVKMEEPPPPPPKK